MLSFDYIWFGFSPNFETYGNTMENWVQDGEQTIGLKFNEVATCSPRSIFAVLPARQVDWDQDTTKSNPFQLANCKFRDGKNMADLMKAAGEFFEEKSIIMATYILCGFANLASIGIQIGGIGALAPKRRSDLSQLGILALIGGTLASLFTAVIVGVLI